jgi:hypothetical protein
LTRSGDLARAQSGPPPTAESPIAPNGYPANPAAKIPNRAVAGTLVADLERQKLFSSLLLAHRRHREADPPPGLSA